MYRIISHTADIGLAIVADSIQELFVEALHGFNEIVYESFIDSRDEQMEINIEAQSIEELFVNWLNEINYLLLVKRAIVTNADKIKIREIEDKFCLDCDVTYINLAKTKYEISMEIKSVTFHDLEILHSSTGCSTKIYFDI